MAIISETYIKIIHALVRHKKISYKFDTLSQDVRENDDTFKFMMRRGYNRSTLADIILLLKASDCYSIDKDSNPNFQNGNVFKFKKTYEGEQLYIKVKVYFDADGMLIFSIHEEGLYK